MANRPSDNPWGGQRSYSGQSVRALAERQVLEGGRAISASMDGPYGQSPRPGPGGADLHPRPAWLEAQRLNRLPPLEAGQAPMGPNNGVVTVLEAFPPGRPAPAAYLDPLPVRYNSYDNGANNQFGERLAALEARAAMAEQRATAAEQRASAAEQRASSAEQRAFSTDQRAMSLEQAAGEIHRAHDIQNQRLAAVSGELARAAAELNDLRLRHEGAHATSASVAQQLLALNSEVRGQEAKLAAAQAALQESLRLGSELRGQVAMLSDELSRANADRAAAQGAIERLGRAMAEGQAVNAMEARRQLDEQGAAFRAELIRRQQAHLEAMAGLNREVEAYRTEAAAAGNALHHAVDRLNSRLHGEEAALDRLRVETAAAAAGEAALIGNLRGQVGELQAVLNGMSQQLVAEQAMRHQDTVALDTNMKAMEGALLQAQDQVVRRTVAMLEGKAGQLMRMVADVDGAAQMRDEETKAQGEQQLGAFVKAAARKDKVGLERMMVLEGALRDIATASSASLEALQQRLDQGLAQVAAAVDVARASTEDREASLRTQINGALQKIRAYARDMEESLEQERVKLEEVVKLEIRARQQSTEQLKSALDQGVVKMADRLAALESWEQKSGGELQRAVESLRTDMARLQSQFNDELAALRNAQAGQVRDVAALQSAAQSTGTQLAAQAAALAAAAQELSSHKASLEGHKMELAGLQRASAALGSDLAALRQQAASDVAAVRNELLQETGERRKAYSDLKQWFDQNQVDAKLAEEVLRQEVDSRFNAVDRRAQKDRQDHDTLEALVQVHSGVFVDVQRQLTSLDQRAKTTEANLANAVEDINERMEEAAAKASKDAADNRAAVEGLQQHTDTQFTAAAASRAQIAKELSDKLDRNQQVLEDVMAQYQEETQSAINDLIAKSEELQRMLEDEVAELDELIDIKVKEVDEKAATALKVRCDADRTAAEAREAKVAEEAAAALAAERTAAEARDGEVAAAAAAALEARAAAEREEAQKRETVIVEDLESFKKETNAALSTATAAHTAAMAALATELANRTQALTDLVSAARGDARGQYDQLAGRLTASEAAAAEKLAATVAATEEKMDTTRQRIEDAFVALGTELRGGLEAQKEELAKEGAALRAELGEALEAQHKALAASRAELMGAVEAAQSGLEEALNEVREESEAIQQEVRQEREAVRQEMAVARDEMTGVKASVDASRSQVIETVAATKSELERALEAQKTDMKTAIEELVVALEEEKAAMAESQEQQRKDIQALVEKEKAEMAAEQARQKAEMAAEQARQKAELKATLEADKAAMDASLDLQKKDVKALVDSVEASRQDVVAMHAAQQASVVVQQASLAASVQKQQEAFEGFKQEMEEALDEALAHMQNDVGARIDKELADFPALDELREEVRQALVEADNAAVADRKATELKVARLEGALEGTRGDWDKAREETQAQMKQLEEKIKELTRQAEERSKLQEEAAKKLDTQMKEMDEHARALDEHVRALDEQADALDEHDKAFEEQAKNAADVARQLGELKGQLDELSKRADEDRRDDVRKDLATVQKRVDDLYGKVDEHTEHVDDMLKKQEALLKEIKDQPSGPTKEEMNAEMAKLLTPVRKEMDELRKAFDDDDVINEYELDERLAQERAETGKQLDAIKTQLAREQEAKLKAAEGPITQVAKDSAIADLEDKMHRALDTSLERIRGEVAEDIKPMRLDLERLKGIIQNKR